MSAPSIQKYFLAKLVVVFIYVYIGNTIPIVVNTWPFTEATIKGWNVIANNGSALDAVEQGGSVCEEFGKCATSVGYGADPDEIGETTLDAMIMDGTSHDVGAVGDLRRVKSALSVARAVLEYTTHTFLVGESATNFAAEMGFSVVDLHSNFSTQQFKSWRKANCQPNYRQNVAPDPTKSCGPYQPVKRRARRQVERSSRVSPWVDENNHDTIGLIAIDKDGNIAGGTTTNGMNHKVPGRVGDSPVAGAGAYVDKDIGGAAGTGDGDVMMRFLPAYQTVSYMEQGLTPADAAERSINRILKYYPTFSGAVVAVNLKGDHGGACHGFDLFPYSVQSAQLQNVTVYNVTCIKKYVKYSASDRKESNYFNLIDWISRFILYYTQNV
ncbi:N(4)-(Beta-N-acetylglucosaminyl)-L-asparaginase-like [Liolophura sinensis]|uniref:N(4)-(Beta-N-acetylglucosaminyl)-L-asparaginase- like n=1 Tax=Liolophura sinensis TaxID=3198878 RepID=UPI003159566C